MKQFLYLASVLLVFSCSQDYVSNEQIDNEELMSRSNGCSIDLSDPVVSYTWSPDCKTAFIDVEFCCVCAVDQPSLPGDNTLGCTFKEGNTVELFIEFCPFQFETYRATIQPTSISAGSCHGVTFAVDTECGAALIVDLIINGESLDWDYDGVDDFC
jgi:hypothetical protein